MPAKRVSNGDVAQMIAVRARRGGPIHATSLANARQTACGRSCDGWMVAPIRTKYLEKAQIDCLACKAVMFRRVAPRGRR